MKASTLGFGFDFSRKKQSGGTLPGLNFETQNFADKDGGLHREQITLNTGEAVSGFLCEVSGTVGAREITDFGGWRHYVMADQQTHKSGR